MFGKPKAGWSTFKLFDIEAEASYLVDIPFEWLKACLFAIQNKIPVALFIDEEGSEVCIHSYYTITYLIVNRDDEIKCHKLEYDFRDLTLELIKDIRAYYEEWVQWSPYETEEEDFERRRKELKELLLETENALENIDS